MTATRSDAGRAELRAACAPAFALVIPAAMFSAVVNLLMLTGPLYMLQVYDRVLASRSEETLAALSLLVACLFIGMGVLDHARSRLMVLAGARVQQRLDARVFAAALRRSALVPHDPAAFAAQRDLDCIHRLCASPVLLALFDLPWSPFFLAGLFFFHPWLGFLATGGGGVLVATLLLGQRLTAQGQHDATVTALHADRMSDALKGEAELLRALGMTGNAFLRWQKARGAASAEAVVIAGKIGGFGVFSRTFRVFLQSAMLGLGALVVLRGEMSAGAMIAGSILTGRALAPIEMAVGQWAVVQRARDGWSRLADLLRTVPADPPRTVLPRPRGLIEVENLTLVPPGESRPTLRMVGFRVEPGQALGIIGPSGAGKSTIARAVLGVWHPTAGSVRLDGARLDQYGPDTLGGLMGYLPQRVQLFDGTIADNIARLRNGADAAGIVAAARQAGAHDMIVGLADGYDTRVAALGGRLSGGQLQRVGLARALYGDPVAIVLDEPNSNLDNEGSAALNQAIRAMKASGKAVLVLAHRPAAIQECDLLLVIEDGMRKAFGPRDAVLRDMVRNRTDIVKALSPAGAA